MTKETEDKPHNEVRIERLYDYTKFHVGLYASLVFGVIALIGIGQGEVLDDQFVVGLAAVSVLSWVISGIAGGVILGTLVELDCSLEYFQKNLWGPFGRFRMLGKYWENLEHLSFWVGVLAAVSSFSKALSVLLC
uniref:hypothetical protein n=1 Tax=Marinobacterium profundum TaxID=1714300 RepID=UPI000B19EA05|nr:hypothetical protein [Marinobacterium profundum]